MTELLVNLPSWVFLLLTFSWASLFVAGLIFVAKQSPVVFAATTTFLICTTPYLLLS